MDSCERRCKYDVFLSFRGEDTRKNFADHLYAALKQKGLTTFRDHESLARGKEISSELLKAIEASRISIIIFSKNYASSPWCLNELVKIVECKEQRAQIVYPIFYGITPSEVRSQSGEFQKAFEEHEEYNKGKARFWRNAMKEVAALSGWYSGDRCESELIREIVDDVSSKLCRSRFSIPKELVGMDSRIEKLMELIKQDPDDVRMIGIFGMGGIGKTTIARVVYDSISDQFEGSSFLANVRETSKNGGLVSLQKQLLYQILVGKNYMICNEYDGKREIKNKLQHKKVLVVIDDVVHENQLENLAGNHDWFGVGSRIIITTRDKHLLIRKEVDALYEIEKLNHDEAFQLFSLKAFGHQLLKDYEKSLKAFGHQPLKDYEEFSELFVKYAGGLPLALQVLGSFLFRRTVDEWKSALERLNKDSYREVLDILQISFDGLQEVEKKIFLDIACFFKGENIDYVMRILDGCGFNSRIGIRVLIDKTLITISNNRIWMHDLLQEMGQQIVKRESPEEPGRRSRLWKEEDVYHVLTKNTGTEAIEGMVLNFCQKDVHLSAKAFSKMINLRVLKVLNAQLATDLEYLSNELRLLKWEGYPLKSLPSSLRLDKTIELEIHCSRIEQLWKGNQLLNQLKSISLSHSWNLEKTPDFTMLPNLEELVLEECPKLHEIHPSLAFHNKLILLNLKKCTSLITLPSKMNMKSLKKLILSGCSKLKKFPEIVGVMECLLEIFLDGTAIKEFLLSIDCLPNLVSLNLKGCKNLESLPSNLDGLKSLKTLNLSGCCKLENLPKNLVKVESLEELDLSGTALRRPESSIFCMKNLKALSFHGCRGTSSKSWYSHFPLFSSSYPTTLELPPLSGLCSLAKLDLSDCNLCEGAIPSDIGNLFALEELNLSKNNFVSLPASINRLSRLEYLKMEDCKSLQSLPELPSSINTVRLDACTSLERLSDSLKLCKSEWSVISCLKCFKLLDCNNIASSMLDFLKTMSSQRIEYSIVIPGSEIPKWFRHHNEGSSIKIERPPLHVESKGKLEGYAVCCVFFVHKHKSAFSDVFGTHRLFCYLKADEDLSSTCHFTHFEEKFGHAISDHLWLLYLSYHEYFDTEWQNKYNTIQFSFASEWGPGLEVKRCGVLPIYEQDMKAFLQTTNQGGSSGFDNLNEFHQEFFTMDATTDYDTAEPSGSGYYDEELQHKRSKRPKFS